MSFISYPHIERLGKEDVEGILAGQCYIFPKIDGTNGSVWLDFVEGEEYLSIYKAYIAAGSRNRQLSLDSDNHGFYASVSEDEKLKNFFSKYPHIRLYGEWLVPHTFKDYRPDAWRKFYVFDVSRPSGDSEDTEELVSYEEYKPWLDAYGIEYIPAVKIIKNPSDEELRHEIDNNFYLCKDNTKPGEGIVIKNYEYKNKWGRQVWAKMVREEFKEGNLKAFGTPEAGEIKVEERIVEKYVTKALCEKEYSKITATDVPKKTLIPRVLETIWHALITEESWNFIKDHNNPTIDFKRLRGLCVYMTKKNLPQLFL